MARKKLDLVLEDVTIESVAAEGKALTHFDGAVVFVESAVPGDVVDIRVTKKKPNYMEGFVVKMKKPSEHRLKPFCEHFGFCGGCKWQPLPYEMQLQAKQQQVMDALTRNPALLHNPAYMLSAMWYIAGNGKGDKNMVIVPYSDRLILLSRYLQQLVMESLGKELDLDGNVVHQGLNVFGNKGGTDAHAFIQQLNDGRNDFFITFIEVLKDSTPAPVSDGIDMGDYLHGFLTGLSNALRGHGRSVIEMRIPDVNAFCLGMIIALYERAVAAYAELIHINAFHQPGVQAYKLASKGVIKLLTELESSLPAVAPFSGSAAELAQKLNLEDNLYELEGILAKLSANSDTRRIPVRIGRAWSKDGGWVYTVEAK